MITATSVFHSPENQEAQFRIEPVISSRAAIVFLVWAIWLSLEYWCFGPDSFVRLHNLADTSLPQMIALKGNVIHGLFGTWNPQFSTGADRASLPYTTDLDAVPFLFLPGWLAYATVMFVQRFIAGLFTFRLLHDRLAVSSYPALYAALAYALFDQPLQLRSSTGFSLLDYLATPGIPLVLWILSGIDANKRIRSAVGAVSAGVFLAFAGGPHISLFVAPLLLYWFAVVFPRRDWMFWTYILLFFIAWAVVAGIINMPQVLLAADSTRFTYRLEFIWGRLPSGIPGVFAFFRNFLSSLEGNFVFLILLVTGLIKSRFRHRALNALALALIFCVAVWVSYRSIAIALRPVSKALSAFNCERFCILVPFLFCVAGGVALHEITNGWRLVLESNGVRRYGLAAAGLLPAILVVGLVWQSFNVKLQTLGAIVEGQNYRAYYLNPDLLRLAKADSAAQPFRVATVVVGDKILPVFPPGAVWAYGLETADSWLNLQPRRYRDFWAHLIAPVMTGDEGLQHWVQDFGCQLYLFAPNGGFPDDSKGASIGNYYRLDLLSLANVRYVVSPIPLQAKQLVAIPSQVRVEQLAWQTLSRSRRLLSILLGHYQSAPLYIYENQDYLPRFFLATHIHVSANASESLDAMAASTLTELGSTAFLEARDASQVPVDKAGDGTGIITLRKYAADEIELAVTATAPTLMVLTNNYSPYWKAAVDGKEAKIVPTDHTFQGVWLEAGNHNVVLKYGLPLWPTRRLEN